MTPHITTMTKIRPYRHDNGGNNHVCKGCALWSWEWRGKHDKTANKITQSHKSARSTNLLMTTASIVTTESITTITRLTKLVTAIGVRALAGYVLTLDLVANRNGVIVRFEQSLCPASGRSKALRGRAQIHSFFSEHNTALILQKCLYVDMNTIGSRRT
jgi:hypothetical protein